MHSLKLISTALAAAFVAGEFNEDAIVESGSRLLGKRWRWLRPLARRVIARFHRAGRPRQDSLRRFIQQDAGLRRAAAKYQIDIRGQFAAPEMCPARGRPELWNLPSIATPDELADWLGVNRRELDWFADRFGFERKIAALRARRYRYRVHSKGTRRFRVIEIPKRCLKDVQRQILHSILDRVPPHEAAHAFRKGHSVLTFTKPHVDRSVVLKMDLQDFFPSIPMSRIAALFRTLGYPESVANLLAGLCSNTVPVDVWNHGSPHWLPRSEARSRWPYERPHLPQGAPTSPAVANLCAFRLDLRLASLAQVAGAAYTRYADDLAFSGDEYYRRRAGRFRDHVAAIVMEEGFRVNFHKTRIMRQSVCQRLAGVVVNKRSNITRADYDRLKAILHNCRQHGPDSQNRQGHCDFRSHLAGQIAYVASIHPQRAQSLRATFDTIEW